MPLSQIQSEKACDWLHRAKVRVIGYAELKVRVIRVIRVR